MRVHSGAFGRRLGLWLSTLAIGLICLSPVTQAFAHPRWTLVQTISFAELQRNGWAPPIVEDRTVLSMDARWRAQDWFALLGNTPPDEYPTRSLPPRLKPFTTVFGIYDPQSASGRIEIVRGVLMPNRDFQVLTAPFKPTSMDPRGRLPIPTDRTNWTDLGIGDAEAPEVDWLQNYAYWNRGKATKLMNPFAEFAGHPDGVTFINIQPAAFFAAVGWAATWSRAIEGWIATLDQREEMRKKTRGNIVRKRVTYTKRVYVKPAWTHMVPATFLNANAETYGFCFPAADCGNQYGQGRTANARNFAAGWNFHHQGVGHNLPVDETLVFSHSKTTASWTMLAMVVFTAVLSAVTAGAVAALGGPNLATAIGMNAIGGQAGVGAAAAAGAASGALVNAGWNYAQGVHSLTDPVNRVFASGVSPLRSLAGQLNRWDSRPFTRAFVEAGPLAAAGAFGRFFTAHVPGGIYARSATTRTLRPEYGMPRRVDPYTGQPIAPTPQR